VSADTTTAATRREATLRQAQVRSDLLGLLDLLPPAELQHRWRLCGVTIDDLKRARVAFARTSHPDRHRDAAAARRLAKANAVLDSAIANLKLGDINAINGAAIR
jgi:hypothetical protein